MLITIVLTALFVVPYASFFEWTLHRFFMHRPIGKFDYAYKAHALVHHRIFKADHTYHLRNEEDKHTIHMAWWNGPLLILISGIPFDLAGWFLGTWAIPITAAAVIGIYYGVYESLHWCMHLPKRRRLEFSWLFRRLNGHHLLHHRYMGRNFNVVLPLADFLLGTLLTSSQQYFKQAMGPMIPIVCPKVEKNWDKIS